MVFGLSIRSNPIGIDIKRFIPTGDLVYIIINLKGPRPQIYENQYIYIYIYSSLLLRLLFFKLWLKWVNHVT